MPKSLLWLIVANIAVTAFCSITARLGMSLMEPVPFAVLSLATAALPLCALPLRSGALRRLWDRRYVASFVGLGFLGTTITSLLLFYAGKTVPASRIVILGQVEILISMLFGFFLLNERIGRKQIAATGLIVTGMLIALHAGRMDSFGSGDLMILAMPLCFQLSHLISKRLLSELDPAVVSAGRTVYGLAFLLPMIPFMAPPAAWASCLASQRALGLILFQGLVINALSLWLWYSSLKHLDLSKITPLLLTYPLLTLLAAKFMPGLNEPVAARQFLGAALVIAGGAVLSRLASEQPRRPV